jgi:hypothetical protein
MTAFVELKSAIRKNSIDSFYRPLTQSGVSPEARIPWMLRLERLDPSCIATRSEISTKYIRLISREIDSAFVEATSRNDLLQRVASINAIPHATVICVVAYF